MNSTTIIFATAIVITANLGSLVVESAPEPNDEICAPKNFHLRVLTCLKLAKFIYSTPGDAEFAVTGSVPKNVRADDPLECSPQSLGLFDGEDTLFFYCRDTLQGGANGKDASKQFESVEEKKNPGFFARKTKNNEYEVRDKNLQFVRTVKESQLRA